MQEPAREVLTDNAAWGTAQPELSVLIPFYRDDPRTLLEALDGQATGLPVELVIIDDGGVEPALSAGVRETVRRLSVPVRLIELSRNEGRSRGRNRLAAHARAGALLFLDADMSPDAPSFLSTWLAEARAGSPVAFGGFTVARAPDRAATALHRRLSEAGDCATAEERGREPAKHVFTSNLLIRGDVFRAEAFDERFSGWGWEDVEWGLRVSRRWPIRHIDNTATHLGLDPAPALLGKWEQSAANFARIVEAHESVRRFPSYRAAKALKRAPGRTVWRPALKRLALAEWAPIDMRALAAKAYRAALYAEVV